MKKVIDHNIKAQIKSEAPEICLEVKYMDDFTDDHYVISNNSKDTKNSNSMNFTISKNGKDLTSIEMKNRDVSKFLNEFLNITKDDDFNTEFKSKIYETSNKQIQDFFEFYDNSLVRKGLTLEGEISRMKKMAGIIKN